MTIEEKSQANRLLGYPDDARLLIINADDFGMCHSVNDAIFRAFRQSLLHSTTLMVPCPWAPHAMHFLSDHPKISFGIHLTAISDWFDYRWRPITNQDKVPSLVDKAGYFHSFEKMHELLLDHVNLDELEMEFRAQVEAVLIAGLHPTHLDWHGLRIGGRKNIFDLILRLAREYGLALRVMGNSSIKKIQNQGLPCNDYDFMDSYLLDPVDQSTRYYQMLRDLPAGLSEWATHPGLENEELLAIEGNSRHIRQRDFNFLISQEAHDIVKEEGIILLDYRVLQEVWREH